MKSIGLSDEVYQDLLRVKHLVEEKQHRVISYDEIIFMLIRKINGEDENVGDTNK
jgi:predicted CopG family antitoxin